MGLEGAMFARWILGSMPERITGFCLLAGITAWLIAGMAAADTLPADSNLTYEKTKKLPDLHHVVGVVLPEEMKTPKQLKLRPDRVLRCDTCHGLKDMDKTPYKKVNRKAKDFLRGGPYPRLEKFCFECHDEEQFERPNIHVMRDRQGQLKEDHCTYCHEEVNRDRDQPRRSVDWKLRLPPDKLCFGCHLKTPHFNALEHQSVKPKDKMKEHMKESMERHHVILPLSDEGRLMCPTCHNPHQGGVINAAKNPAGTQVENRDLKEGIAYQDHPWSQVIRDDKKERLAEFNGKTGSSFQLDYRRIDKEPLLRLPAKDGTLCLACHEFEN